jgi:hypothetical protein
MSAAEHSNTSTHNKETTGEQTMQSTPPAKKGSNMAAQLLVFFQLLLHRFQDVVNPSKVLPPSNHGVLGRPSPHRFGN